MSSPNNRQNLQDPKRQSGQPDQSQTDVLAGHAEWIQGAVESTIWCSGTQAQSILRTPSMAEGRYQAEAKNPQNPQSTQTPQNPSNPERQPGQPEQSQTGLLAGHAEWIKGAAESTIGSLTGSRSWRESGEQDKAHARAALQAAVEHRDPAKSGYGRAEEIAGRLTGCEGMRHEGAASKSKPRSD
ncbi:hypothetical protein VTJ49DRAFT_4855 [Mycothermus thermophilus]|uniref:Uncharacterized protein n=1 Tax=Humicola insolens TaxID=85995 RepID=A0ABR3VLJ2_HUMIN